MKSLIVVGLDAFDTPAAGCTTHLASLLLLYLYREGIEPIDYPWLVRLNPSIPWKTRGNAAVALFFETDGKGERDKLVRIVMSIVRSYDVLGSKASAILLEFDSIDELLEDNSFRQLYINTLTSYTLLDQAHRLLNTVKKRLVAGHGIERRGVIGALASLAGLRPGDDQTFELLAYRYPSMWGKPRRIDPWSVKAYDAITGAITFANYDYEKNMPLIAPHGPDPVLYGLRGEDPRKLVEGLKLIKVEEDVAHWTIFRTNQATDVHLKYATSSILPYNVVAVEGRIEGKHVVRGGHVVVELDSEKGRVYAAFYAETGWLNRFAKNCLEEGDKVKIYGSVKPHSIRLTVNVEKIEVCKCVEDYPFVPGTCILTASTRAVHHLSKPFERYMAEKLLGDLSKLPAKKLFKPLTKIAGLGQEFTSR